MWHLDELYGAGRYVRRRLRALIDLRVAILTQDAGNSANGTLILTYTVDGVPDQVTVQADAAPPIVGGGACTTFSAAEKLCLASLAA